MTKETRWVRADQDKGEHVSKGLIHINLAVALQRSTQSWACTSCSKGKGEKKNKGVLNESTVNMSAEESNIPTSAQPCRIACNHGHAQIVQRVMIENKLKA